MAEPVRRPVRPPAERLAAWVVTGPPGHLYSAVVDLATYAARSARQRMLAAAGRRRSSRR